MVEGRDAVKAARRRVVSQIGFLLWLESKRPDVTNCRKGEERNGLMGLPPVGLLS